MATDMYLWMFHVGTKPGWQVHRVSVRFVARRGRDPFATPNIAAVAKLAMQGCAQVAINRSDSQQQGLTGLPQNIYKSVS